MIMTPEELCAKQQSDAYGRFESWHIICTKDDNLSTFAHMWDFKLVMNVPHSVSDQGAFELLRQALSDLELDSLPRNVRVHRVSDQMFGPKLNETSTPVYSGTLPKYEDLALQVYRTFESLLHKAVGIVPTQVQTTLRVKCGCGNGIANTADGVCVFCRENQFSRRECKLVGVAHEGDGMTLEQAKRLTG